MVGACPLDDAGALVRAHFVEQRDEEALLLLVLEEVAVGQPASQRDAVERLLIMHLGRRASAEAQCPKDESGTLHPFCASFAGTRMRLVLVVANSPFWTRS